MEPRTTLATTVKVTDPNSSITAHDVQVTVHFARNGGRDVRLDVSDTHVFVRLSAGERIALIEALGGQAS